MYKEWLLNLAILLEQPEQYNQFQLPILPTFQREWWVLWSRQWEQPETLCWTCHQQCQQQCPQHPQSCSQGLIFMCVKWNMDAEDKTTLRLYRSFLKSWIMMFIHKCNGNTIYFNKSTINNTAYLKASLTNIQEELMIFWASLVCKWRKWIWSTENWLELLKK